MSMASDPKIEQPTHFAFADENLAKAQEVIARYPAGHQASAVMPLLWMAQRQHNGWLPRVAMDVVADMLQMPRIRVYEVASFYTMYNRKPVGENFIQVCRTTPCWLRGSDDITNACKKRLGVGLGQTTADGKFSVVEVECLGACVNAPMVQINDDYFEDLTPESMVSIIDALARGEQPKVGTQVERQFSAPVGGATTLNGDVGRADNGASRGQ